MEEALVACGFTTWAMVEWEADDALAAAAAVADADPRVEQVLIVTPDKDLCQCVRGTRVVQYDRRKDEIVDEAGVIAKFGVPPGSIADYLALVGDSADGLPGPARLGREERRDRAGQVRLDRGDPAVVGRLGPAGVARRREVGPHAAATRWPMRCCFERSPRWRSTFRSAPSTTGGGTVRPTRSRRWPRNSVHPISPTRATASLNALAVERAGTR